MDEHEDVLGLGLALLFIGFIYLLLLYCIAG
jgi:hypothetical protein